MRRSTGLWMVPESRAQKGFASEVKLPDNVSGVTSISLLGPWRAAAGRTNRSNATVYLSSVATGPRAEVVAPTLAEASSVFEPLSSAV